jgi:hypothetical protein
MSTKQAHEPLTDAARVQPRSITTENSKNVLETLRHKVPIDIFNMLEDRVRLGEERYGVALQTFNGREALLDCLQESLDGIMYAQQDFLEGGHPAMGTHLVNRFVDLVMIIQKMRTRL